MNSWNEKKKKDLFPGLIWKMYRSGIFFNILKPCIIKRHVWEQTAEYVAYKSEDVLE